MATTNPNPYENQVQACPNPPVVIVVVPFSAQSHLNQLLHLSCLISSYDNKIPIHYVASSLHNSQVKSRACRLTQYDISGIRFHDIPIPNNDHDLMAAPPQPDIISFTPHHHRFISALLHSLASAAKRLVVIHDFLTEPLVEYAESIPNAETYSFNCISAFTTFTFIWESMGRSSDYLELNLPCLDDCWPPEVNRHMDYRFRFTKPRHSAAGDLYNTCRSVESIFLDLLENDKVIQGQKKLWAVGPLHGLSHSFRDDSISDHECLEWLNEQEPNTVLYVSFGTTVSMEDKQIEEIAFGLEQSGKKFIWVLRDADKGDVSDEGVIKRPQLPNGFEDRVKGMGMVVREWAPQVEILGHPSTGGFMSHCGWNSCLESISMGVPIAAWPMCVDQPRNAVLITEVLKVGLEVREWGKREELVSSTLIKKVVERLMGSDEGDEIRKRAEELGSEVRKSTAEGEVTRREWDSFIAHITRSISQS